MHRVILFVLILGITSFSALAQDSLGSAIQLIGEIDAEEDIYATEVAGDYLYAVNRVYGDGILMVFDISSPGSPKMVHSVEFEDFEATSLLIDDSHLYVAGEDGLKIFDISSAPSVPSLLVEHTSLMVDNEEWEIQDYIVKHGDILFANADLWSLMAIDMSDIYNPQFLDGFSFNWSSVDRFIITEENIGWLDDGDNLRRIDFSDPTNLDVALSDDKENYIEIDGELYDFVVHNDTLFAASWTSGPEYVSVYKLSERRLIDQIDIDDSLSYGFSSSIAYHSESRRLVVRGVSHFLEIAVHQNGTLHPVKTHKGEGVLKFHGNLLITEGDYKAEGFIYQVSTEKGNENGGGNTGSIVELLNENFDEGNFPPTGWERWIHNQNYFWSQGATQNWGFDAIDPEDIGSAVVVWTDQDQDEWMVSPELDLSTVNDPKLSFYVLHGTTYLSYAVMKLKISTDVNHKSWTELWQTEDDGGGLKWRKVEVDLSIYTDEHTVKLGWQYVGNDGNSMAIDSIYVFGKDQITTSFNPEIEIPEEFLISQNYPNPFNPTTQIMYELPKASMVTIKVFDMLGRKIMTLVDEYKAAGRHQATFDGTSLSSGMYIYQIRAGSFVQTRKMMLIK